jgi:hypothetical protein
MRLAVILTVLVACAGDGGGDDDDAPAILVSYDAKTFSVGEDSDFYAYRVDGSGSHGFVATWTLADPTRASVTLDDAAMKATLRGLAAGTTTLTVAGQTDLEITITP